MICRILPQTVRDVSYSIDTIPGDKSISHRSVLIGSLAKGTSSFENFLFSDDCTHSIDIFRMLGIVIKADKLQRKVEIQGNGLDGLMAPEEPLYVGNSGTGIRLISGVLAGQPFSSVITGDDSICRRPMKRVTLPLEKMGARIQGEERNGDVYPPLKITGGKPLKPIRYALPMASAQVKSAVLLAGLFADGQTEVSEPSICRDHTERIMAAFGVPVQREGLKTTLNGLTQPVVPASSIFIPSDFSSAAFFIVLGLICGESGWMIRHVGLNPTRNKLLDVLKEMGATLTVSNVKGEDGEPYGDIHVMISHFNNIAVDPQYVPVIIDEFPILAVAALFGEGTLRVTDAAELRVKESDRIHHIAQLVKAIGGHVHERPDGFDMTPGNEYRHFDIDSAGDHRIAMAAIVAAIASGKGGVIRNCEYISTSFPNFFEILDHLNIIYSLTE